MSKEASHVDHLRTEKDNKTLHGNQNPREVITQVGSSHERGDKKPPGQEPVMSERSEEALPQWSRPSHFTPHGANASGACLGKERSWQARVWAAHT